jgi:ABC-2 type transport system permease protein
MHNPDESHDMRKLWPILKKEMLLLSRDLPGLIILFLMPFLLIFVVTLAQENALKFKDSKTPLLFTGDPENPLTSRLLSGLDSSGFFVPVTSLNGVPLSGHRVREMVEAGDYKFAVIVGKAQSSIILLSDPTLQGSYHQSVTNSLNFIIKGTQSRMAMEEILGGLPGTMQPLIGSMIEERMQHLDPVNKEYAVRDKQSIEPNVIQNNVPGFIMFAMFFIVIPLAGSLITEKNEGSFQRLRSLPVSITAIIGGKVIIYLVICLVQFMLMMFIGTWVFPVFFGFPALEFGHQYLAIAVATVAASLAAIGFGIMVGAAASTHNQAALFGSVMVVLLGIISGTFLPVHLMPRVIQYISYVSPIRWGLDNYLNIFIREGNLLSIIPNTLMLVIFFGLAMIGSIAIFAKQK